MKSEMNITFRPAGPGDDEFLCKLYAGTRQEELAVTGWDAARKAAFLKQQYTAQAQHYRVHYEGADSRILLSDGHPVGRFMVYRMKTEIRVVDIALLPEFRGKGIGGWLMREVMDEAVETDRSVTIHVEKFNPAMRFYKRLGFKPVEDKGIYWFMEWKPPAQSSPVS